MESPELIIYSIHTRKYTYYAKVYHYKIQKYKMILFGDTNDNSIYDNLISVKIKDGSPEGIITINPENEQDFKNKYIYFSLLLGFLYNKISFIRWITFKDVFLFSKVNFLLYGKTWFNRCFNASSLNHKDYQIMKQTILFKKKRDFSKLWYSVLINTGIEKETLEAMYDGAKTYKAFFNTIYDKYGMEPLKIIFYYFPEMNRLYEKINHFYIDLYQKRFITNPRIETLNGMDGMITNPGCV